VLSLVGMEMVILPRSCIDMIKSLPETHVSIKKHHHDVFLGEYTYMGTKADEFDAAMRYDLTRNTPVVLASFNAEVRHAIEENIGPCKDWTALKPRAAMCRVASLMSGRAFVGVPLSRDEQWVEATVNYTGNVTKAWLVLRTLNRFIRPVMAPFLPEVKALMGTREMTSTKMAPLLERMARGDNGQPADGPGGDMIRWFQGRYSKKASPQELARDQLLATFASIYNLSNALTYLMFDLASYPEYIEPLRQELDEVLGDKGSIDKDSLQRLKKLDSFVRESQRHSPPSLGMYSSFEQKRKNNFSC
jgi:cytochrome P450